MTIIYGLGNNEAQYLNTKHNIGRIVLESIAQAQGLQFTTIRRTMVAKYNQDVYLVYSKDFMNTSGQFLNELISYLKPTSLQLIILQDDSDIQESANKVALGGSSGGHNGISDIHKYILNWGISTQDIIRIKIGIRPPHNTSKAIDFVLKLLSDNDIINLKELSKVLNNNINSLITKDINKLQNLVN
jgi:peptidyl-tRNA hydrolase, PTH1 family